MFRVIPLFGASQIISDYVLRILIDVHVELQHIDWGDILRSNPLIAVGSRKNMQALPLPDLINLQVD